MNACEHITSGMTISPQRNLAGTESANHRRNSVEMDTNACKTKTSWNWYLPMISTCFYCFLDKNIIPNATDTILTIISTHKICFVNLRDVSMETRAGTLEVSGVVLIPSVPAQNRAPSHRSFCEDNSPGSLGLARELGVPDSLDMLDLGYCSMARQVQIIALSYMQELLIFHSKRTSTQHENRTLGPNAVSTSMNDLACAKLHACWRCLRAPQRLPKNSAMISSRHSWPSIGSCPMIIVIVMVWIIDTNGNYSRVLVIMIGKNYYDGNHFIMVMLLWY